MLIKELQNVHTIGTVTFIGVRPGRKEPVAAKVEVMAVRGRGLEGDRYKTKDGSRQVTLIQKEHLDVISNLLKRQATPDLARRNLVIEGVNLLSLKGHQFQVGQAILEYSGECHPCSRMEENFGVGGYNAMRGHGGITARVIRDGLIALGDQVRVLPEK
jgi:MOSC domain-containing protein YiiM